MNGNAPGSSAEANRPDQLSRLDSFRQSIESAGSSRRFGREGAATSKRQRVSFARRCVELLLQPVMLLLFLTTLYTIAADIDMTAGKHGHARPDVSMFQRPGDDLMAGLKALFEPTGAAGELAALPPRQEL